MKKLVSILLVLLLLGSTATAISEVPAIPGAQEVEVNGKSSDLKGYNIDDYNYFKLRDLAAVLKKEGMDFALSGDYKEINIYPGKVYEKKSDDLKPLGREKKQALPKTMTVNMNGTSREYRVYNIDGYNYFKLREMGELLGFRVDYDKSRNKAMITAVSESSDKKTEPSSDGKVVLGDERITGEYSSYIDGKKIGIVTNQTGVNSQGKSVVEILQSYPNTTVVAAYSPEHGLDGKEKAGKYVPGYYDKRYGLQVYSLYGKTRKPSADMVKGIDTFVFDMQDIGSRTYTYMSTLNYVMRAAKEYGKDVVVLDRPNPLGGVIVDTFVLEPKYATFIGVDEMPMAHGMTAGELARFFNRKIGCDLKIVPMENWTRDMIWQDTGLPWVQTSPNIPTIESAFLYMATGIGDGTGLGQGDKFHWVGMKGMDSEAFAEAMNGYHLPGVTFTPEKKGSRGGVRVRVTDYHSYNPARTGVYLLATANRIRGVNVPTEGKYIPMFEKVWGTDRMGKALKAKKTPEEIEQMYKNEVEQFKETREQYLLY